MGLLEAARLASRHGGRVTLQPKDLGLVKRIRRQTNGHHQPPLMQEPLICNMQHARRLNKIDFLLSHTFQ